MNIDSHKLHLHPDRTSDWLFSRNIPPIYVEVSPSSMCTQSCTFCAIDFVLEEEKGYIDDDFLLQAIKEMGRVGVRSILFAGEGEPLLHSCLPDFILQAKISGIDVAVATNGTFVSSSFIEKLSYLSWIRFSVNGGNEEVYKKIHQCRSGVWDNVWVNIKDVVKVKKEKKYGLKVGVQCVLLPENEDSIVELLTKCEFAGVDYLSIKPFNQHPLQKGTRYKEYTPSLEKLHERASTLRSKVELIVKDNAFNALKDERRYGRCLSVPHFWAYISTNGDVYGCSNFLGDDRFKYGNIHEKGFIDIWNGSRREEAKIYMKSLHDVKECRKGCRMDKCNQYLWELIHHPEHWSFI